MTLRTRLMGALTGRSFDRPDAVIPAPLEAGRNGRRSKAVPKMARAADATAAAGPVRERARAAVHNNAWLSSGVEALVASIAGERGLRPRSQHSDPATREQLAALWRHWSETADAAGRCSFGQLQAQAVRELAVAGECFVRFRPGRDGDVVPFRLQVLPAEQVAEGMNAEQDDGTQIVNGVELDAEGHPVGFHVYPRPAGLHFDTRTERVDASEMMHLYSPKYPGQVRGISWLAPVLVRAGDLDAFEDAELARQKTSAYFVGFVRRAEGDPFGEEGEAQDGSTGLTPLEPGLLQYLEDGEDITFPSVPDPVDGSYVTRHLRAIAAALGITFEQLTTDLSSANYSSARSGVLEHLRRVQQVQAQIEHAVCRPVWSRFVRMAVLSGALDSVDMGQLLDATWLRPKRDWVDPEKDAKAEALQIDAGLKSRTQALVERGYDPEQVDAEIAADRAREKRLGLGVQDKGTGDANE